MLLLTSRLPTPFSVFTFCISLFCFVFELKNLLRIVPISWHNAQLLAFGFAWSAGIVVFEVVAYFETVASAVAGTFIVAS